MQVYESKGRLGMVEVRGVVVASQCNGESWGYIDVTSQ